VLLGISVWIRMQLNESPVFQKMKEEGKGSKAPLTESFARWGNMKVVILALLGATAGQAVVWYTGQFYALFFLLQTLKVEAQAANLLIAASLLVGTPFFIIFGSLSDRIGRKPIVMIGCLLAAATLFPIFKAMTHYANPDLESAQLKSPVSVAADSDKCSFQFNPVGTARFVTSCDIAKSFLARNSVNYANVAAAPGAVAIVKIGERTISSFEGAGLSRDDFKKQSEEFNKTMMEAVKAAGYPAKADMAKVDYVMVTALLTLLVIYVTMVYGPIAAWLVELFPARIRYTSMSLPYHIGNGWFGGFLPTTAFAMVAATGDIYYGLWYPVVIAVMTAVVGTLFLPETKDRPIHHDA
jgi:MFS family permease